MDVVNKQNVVAMTEASHWPTPSDLADAASELANERYDKAQAWLHQMDEVKGFAATLHARLMVFEQRQTEAAAWSVAYASRNLLLQLSELERLEGAQ